MRYSDSRFMLMSDNFSWFFFFCFCASDAIRALTFNQQMRCDLVMNFINVQWIFIFQLWQFNATMIEDGLCMIIRIVADAQLMSIVYAQTTEREKKWFSNFAKFEQSLFAVALLSIWCVSLCSFKRRSHFPFIRKTVFHAIEIVFLVLLFCICSLSQFNCISNCRDEKKNLHIADF